MGPDSERFDESKLIQRERFGAVELMNGHADKLAHSAVYVNSEHLETLAAVRLSLPACDTFAAVQIGLHGAAIPRADSEIIVAYLQNFHPELVPQNPRVGEERLAATVGMQI